MSFSLQALYVYLFTSSVCLFLYKLFMSSYLQVLYVFLFTSHLCLSIYKPFMSIYFFTVFMSMSLRANVKLACRARKQNSMNLLDVVQVIYCVHFTSVYADILINLYTDIWYINYINRLTVRAAIVYCFATTTYLHCVIIIFSLLISYLL